MIVEGAPDSAGTPGTFVTLQGSPANPTGAISPNTPVVQFANVVAAWLRVRVITFTGSGSIAFSLTGSGGVIKPNPAAALNVRTYGATGDGVTDDTAAIRAALAAACSTQYGVTLVFPQGTYIVAKTSTGSVPILQACSNLTLTGPGTIQIASGSGSYYSIIGGAVALSNFHVRDLTINMNSAGNPLISSGDLATYPRIAIITGSGGNNNSYDHVRVTDIRAEWSLRIGSTNSSITNCVLDNVGGGSVTADSSLIYVEQNAENYVVSGNAVTASARNANMAVTAIETHATGVVTGNVITDMLIGMNIAEDTVTVGGSVTGNLVRGAYDCIQLWSNNILGATGIGMQGEHVSENTCVINQRSYLSQIGAMSGIFVNATSNLPLSRIRVTNNLITFDLSNTNTDPINNASMGVGYWDSLGTNACNECDFSANTVINAPSNAVRFSANGSNVALEREVIVNPGASPATLIVQYRAGIFVVSTNPITGFLRISASISDINATARFGYGIELLSANTSDIAIDATVTCADVTCTSLQQAIAPNNGTQLPVIHATVEVPSAKALTLVAVAAQSTIFSMREAVLYAWNGAAWVNAAGGAPHTMIPTASACGTMPIAAGNDRNGFIQVGTGMPTSCNVTFGTAFTAQPYCVVTSLTGSTGYGYSVTTTTLNIAAGGSIGGLQFMWACPLAN